MTLATLDDSPAEQTGQPGIVDVLRFAESILDHNALLQEELSDEVHDL